MPLYEFECQQCGAFEQFLSLKEYGVKVQCPNCDDNAYRVYTPPNLYKTSPNYRKSRGINEKNQESPRVETIIPIRIIMFHILHGWLDTEACCNL